MATLSGYIALSECAASRSSAYRSSAHPSSKLELTVILKFREHLLGLFKMQTVYTAMGMNAREGKPVIHTINEDGEFYFKQFPAADRDRMYKAYEKLRSLGVGIPFTRTRDGVRMEAGIPLPRALKAGRITSANKDTLIAKLKDVHRKLIQARWAHTDVKSQNIVVKWRREGKPDFDVYLIDNDYAAPFGQNREVCTPGVNARSTTRDATGIINADTDTMGFDSVFADIRRLVH